MEFTGAWLDNIMRTIALCPKLFQFCMSFFGGIGLLGYIQSSCSIVMNVLHCTFWGGTWIEDYIMPVFGEMRSISGKE
ncbi:MAG: hypothetical protein MASP_00536 [Candidatus Methanolliviera sp. GoM_asphalt]|nr:MAG: hypothetical protein MASP_00536 [Candidatus Methanolliviera sp. GoM_asphalt]